jgi:ankyrin repeat protein
MILVGDAKSTVMNGGSLLQLAVVEQHAGIARLLVQHGAIKDATDNLGRTPLSVAESNGDSLMVAVLKGEM